MLGVFAWNELISGDVEASKNFYAKVFGWEGKDEPMSGGGTYTIFESGGAPVAGMIPMECTTAPEGTPNHWFSYISVDNVEATCRATVEAGGAVVREPFPVPDMGMIAILSAADGSFFGAMQPERR